MSNDSTRRERAIILDEPDSLRAVLARFQWDAELPEAGEHAMIEDAEAAAPA
jgi:hypothetical protein